MTADHSPTPVRGERLQMLCRGLGVIITNDQAWTGLHPTHVQFQADEVWDGPWLTLNSSFSVVSACVYRCNAAFMCNRIRDTVGIISSQGWYRYQKSTLLVLTPAGHILAPFWLQQQNVIDQRQHYYELHMIQELVKLISDSTAVLLGNHVVSAEDTFQIKQPLCILDLVVLKACSAFFFRVIAHLNSYAES